MSEETDITDGELERLRARTSVWLAASEAIQMQGGIRMTDELAIGLFDKRIRSAGETYGDVAFHRDRVAGLHGL